MARERVTCGTTAIEHSKRSSVQNELSVPVRDEFGKRNVVRGFQRHTPMDHTRRGRYRNLDSAECPKKKESFRNFSNGGKTKNEDASKNNTKKAKNNR